MKGERPLMVAGICARIGGAVLRWLLTFAASTSAECAWVLWLETVALEGTTWDYTDAYTTKDECSKVRTRLQPGTNATGRAAGENDYFNRLSLHARHRGPEGIQGDVN
jgi:hypothetical protein